MCRDTLLLMDLYDAIKLAPDNFLTVAQWKDLSVFAI